MESLDVCEHCVVSFTRFLTLPRMNELGMCVCWWRVKHHQHVQQQQPNDDNNINEHNDDVNDNDGGDYRRYLQRNVRHNKRESRVPLCESLCFPLRPTTSLQLFFATPSTAARLSTAHGERVRYVMASLSL